MGAGRRGDPQPLDYRLIRPRERIEFDSRFCDEHGSPVSPGEVGLPAVIPEVVPHVVTLTTDGEGATVLVVREAGYDQGRWSRYLGRARSRAALIAQTNITSAL